MRGVLHTWGAVACVPLGVVLLVVAESGRARISVAIYLAGLTAMLVVSALYHRGAWSDAIHAVWRKADHMTIFLGIAATYTPVAMLGVGGWARPALLATVWSAAAMGIALQWLPARPPRWLFTAVYVVTGWCAAIALPQLYRGLGVAAFVLVIVGGLGYTVGAVVYAARRPDPRPAVFGYHEVFHACTLVGAACHFIAVLLVVLRAR
jgi:hemolysin III